MKKLIVFLAALTLTICAGAQDSPAWSGPAKILTMSVQPNGNLYVEIDADTPDLGCKGNTDGWLQLNPNYPNFEQQYAMLLAAYMANTKVRIHAKTCGYYPFAENTNISREYE